MSVGLLAVVDDILSAALKASAKSAGVVIDDAAVTPQYVQGLSLHGSFRSWVASPSGRSRTSS
jgi:hypothetical protein